MQQKAQLQAYQQEQHSFGGSTPAAPPPPPPAPTANQSAGAAVQQQAIHADPTGQTYASTLLTGAAQPTSAQNVGKSTLLGGG